MTQSRSRCRRPHEDGHWPERPGCSVSQRMPAIERDAARPAGHQQGGIEPQCQGADPAQIRQRDPPGTPTNQVKTAIGSQITATIPYGKFLGMTKRTAAVAGALCTSEHRSGGTPRLARPDNGRGAGNEPRAPCTTPPPGCSRLNSPVCRSAVRYPMTSHFRTALAVNEPPGAAPHTRIVDDQWHGGNKKEHTTTAVARNLRLTAATALTIGVWASVSWLLGFGPFDDNDPRQRPGHPGTRRDAQRSPARARRGHRPTCPPYRTTSRTAHRPRLGLLKKDAQDRLARLETACSEDTHRKRQPPPARPRRPTRRSGTDGHRQGMTPRPGGGIHGAECARQHRHGRQGLPSSP